MRIRTAPCVVLAVLAALTANAAPRAAIAAPARQMYAAAMSREAVLRTAWQQGDERAAAAGLRQARAIVAAYEAIVRRYPVSGYCDNALWQAASLSADLFARSGKDPDKRAAVRLFEFLAREYPTSPFAARAASQARRLESPAPANAPNAAKGAEPTSASPPSREVPATSLTTIRSVRRTVLAEVVRVAIELDREVPFQAERVENPARLLFDLTGTKAATGLQDANWAYQGDVVRHIRLGRHPNQTTRVVLDLEGVSRYTVVTLYNPYRILIDCERTMPGSAATLAAPPVASATADAAAARNDVAPRSSDPPRAAMPEAGRPQGRLESKEDQPERDMAETSARLAAKKTEAPKAAASEKSTTSGAPGRNRVSMARQLGLGVARIVIDPGHGGRDPGAEGDGRNESDIVLDIALRLEKLLAKQPGVDVVLTRRTDVFVPLEERTQIANREQADLFLSIHANASRNPNARGIETYYLNFATNPDAEAVAARENAASERTMNSLPDIIKAITLNNKLNESRAFATLVQDGLARRLRSANKSLKNLGVKQAPFVVLIGAGMPSVLVEVSFLTHDREGQLLRTESYRQRIAESLADAIVRYKRALKSANTPPHE